MLIKMIDLDMHIDEILFCDTGVEFPDMYEHINKVEKYIRRPITRIKSKYTYKYYMLDHVKKNGKNKGSSGYGWSDFQNRWCTGLLKIKVISDYLKKYDGLEIIEYIGIAADEPQRAEKNKDNVYINYPLIDLNMTEDDCLSYCYSLGFHWNGLYKKLTRVSCYLCPLQRISELKVIYTEYPDLWNKMSELDKKSIAKFGRQFRPDYSMNELSKRFEIESRQMRFII